MIAEKATVPVPQWPSPQEGLRITDGRKRWAHVPPRGSVAQTPGFSSGVSGLAYPGTTGSASGVSGPRLITTPLFTPHLESTLEDDAPLEPGKDEFGRTQFLNLIPGI